MSHQPYRLTAFTLTAHARRRIDQRRIDPSALDAVLRHGLDYPAGSGRTKRMLLHSQISELAEEGLEHRVLEKALRIEAIVGPREQLITCYTRTPPGPARHVRRNGNRRSAGRLA